MRWLPNAASHLPAWAQGVYDVGAAFSLRAEWGELDAGGAFVSVRPPLSAPLLPARDGITVGFAP